MQAPETEQSSTNDRKSQNYLFNLDVLKRIKNPHYQTEYFFFEEKYIYFETTAEILENKSQLISDVFEF